MIARSTDGHKTNASLGAEHLDGDGMVMLKDAFLSVKAKGDAIVRMTGFPTR